MIIIYYYRIHKLIVSNEAYQKDPYITHITKTKYLKLNKKLYNYNMNLMSCILKCFQILNYIKNNPLNCHFID